MVNETTEIEVTIDEVVKDYFDTISKIEKLENVLYVLYRHIVEHAKDSKAEILPTEHGVVEVKQSVDRYNPDVLARLREITDPVMLSEAYTPEHEVTVPETVKRVKERWDARKLGKIAKLGEEHRAIIEESKVMRSPTIKKVEVKGDS